MGEARIDRAGHSFGQYRPGESLSEYAAYFVMDAPGEKVLRTTSHVELLEESRCRKASGERLWCGTCHDVHTTPENRVEWYRDKCLSCHGGESAGVVRACGRGPDCVTCHMPRIPLPGAHSSFTDHWIRIVKAGEAYPA